MYALGFITAPNDESTLTDTGRFASGLGVDLQLGRMVREPRELARRSWALLLLLLYFVLVDTGPPHVRLFEVDGVFFCVEALYIFPRRLLGDGLLETDNTVRFFHDSPRYLILFYRLIIII